jgi:methylase of polypeptide subunit release factors
MEPLKFDRYEDRQDEVVTTPLLGPAALTLLRRALDDFTVDAVQELLGPIGRSAHERGDLTGVARVLPPGERLSTLVRMFLLGAEVDEAAARTALRPLDLEAADALVVRNAGGVRARLEVRPYAEESARPWWVVSDFGSDVRPGPLRDDHVLGIGAASLTLAQATPRRPVERTLDLGTGCGVQALHASAHSGRVVATDVSMRALRMAATTAALSEQDWDLREGSLLDPVADERFDLIVANPPFVVSPGLTRDSGGFDYRDSGLAGDGVSEALLRGLPGLLTPQGSASLLANWVVPSDGDWAGRIGGWLAGQHCDAWVWQREVVEPGAYVTMWLRDAGEVPGTDRWAARYGAWLDWFETSGIAAVGMGLVTLWRNDRGDPSIVCEDVPQAVEQPAGTHLPGWMRRQRWLAERDDAGLLRARLRCADGVVRMRHDLRSDDGWLTELTQLRQSHGMRWELEADDAIAGLVAACDGTVPLDLLVDMLAAVTGSDRDAVVAGVLPVVRDLLARGFLEPTDGSAAP